MVAPRILVVANLADAVALLLDSGFDVDLHLGVLDGELVVLFVDPLLSCGGLCKLC